MKRPGVRSLLLSTEFLGGVLFVFATGFPPFDDATAVDLTLHMLQHVVIVFSGIMIAYPHLGRNLLRRGWRGGSPTFAFAVTVATIVLWHFPGPWDAAVLNPAVHALEHVSFLLVGLVCGSWLPLLSDSGKIGALTAAFFGHMGYAVALIAPFGTQLYAPYPLSDQVILGWALLLTGPLLIVGVAYVIARNPDWLGGMSGMPRTGPRRITVIDKVRVPKWLAPLLSIVLVVSLAGYFAATAYAIGTAQPAQEGTPVVFISETPITWQYSPQQIRVILGVNTTVTWVSRSISYDTVTARGGTFSSGTIAPGGAFTYTFTAPGVYEYYCQYHPWMTGTVLVQESPGGPPPLP